MKNADVSKVVRDLALICTLFDLCSWIRKEGVFSIRFLMNKQKSPTTIWYVIRRKMKFIKTKNNYV